jgi:signal transduction histidine kinase
MLCANHQKRIIDDTLTMSKLDSRLLLITPVDTQPIKVVEKVMRMFENDFASKDIKHRLIIDPSHHALRLDWVKADPSRLTQILVNLLTNGTLPFFLVLTSAIKFTAGRPRREITVILGPVSTTRPIMDHSGLTSPSPSPASDRDALFLSFSVADTGSGLTTKEKTNLFQKFAQASPETHVNYGGSGLGLYISRNLTEMQGGRIAVESRQGEGSTFSFYIETRRGGPPTPMVEGMVDPMAAAAAELTDSRTESTFLQSGIWTSKDIASAQEKRRSRQPSNLPSYRILIVEVVPWIDSADFRII